MLASGRRAIRSCFQVATLLFCAGASAQTAGTLTLVEGRLALVRGSTLYTATQGVRLEPGDILEIDPKGQGQVEFPDGAILNLSQGARAMLSGIGTGARGQSEVVVLSGWAKFTQKKSAKGASYRYLTRLAAVASGEATAVLNAGEDFTSIYIESGAAKFSEIGKNGALGAARDAKGGEFVVRRSGQPAAFTARPSADFVKSMPRHFQDNLPVLLEKLKIRSAEPKREHEVTYAEVEAWVKTGLPLRRGFVKRFEARSRDPEFRRKLIENLREHPEWDRVLFPEKYETKNSKGPGGPSGTQQ